MLVYIVLLAYSSTFFVFIQMLWSAFVFIDVWTECCHPIEDMAYGRHLGDINTCFFPLINDLWRSLSPFLRVLRLPSLVCGYDGFVFIIELMFYRRFSVSSLQRDYH